MQEQPATTAAQSAFRAALLAAGLLVETGVPGVYGRGAAFEEVRLRFDAYITRAAAPEEAEVMGFPPVLPRQQIETSGYLKSFPHLAGTVFAFTGEEDQAREQYEAASEHRDWSGYQRMTELVLAPAACYPVYPAIAGRGPLPASGVTVDTGGGHAFRNEPSGDPARMQMFHIRELVRIGEPEAVTAWRDGWEERAVTLLRRLGLSARVDIASDPFFGRAGELLARSQRAQRLKIEIQVPIAGPGPSAVASLNHHHDHFGTAFGIELASGKIAHSACLGFGQERVVLALLQRHGFDSDSWPAEVRARLWES
jgi:seryl-tRNA synthetase